MKSILKLPKQEELTFPLIRISISNKEVVLFTDYTVGTVIAETVIRDGDVGVHSCSVGDHYDNWTECTNTNIWSELPKGSEIIITA